MRVIVNFGGPRNLSEVESFLSELLCDKEVIPTPFPQFLHNLLFKRIAKKRAEKVAEDYALIGGKSPIHEDTEEIAKKLGSNTLTFHRYLSSTHKEFIEKCPDSIFVLPLFPQYSFATTGSIMKWFSKNLPKVKAHWISSYYDHPLYIQACVATLKEFLAEKKLNEEECLILFSAHGIPKSFVKRGDPYQSQCEISYQKIASFFKTETLLCYQSQFGKEEWIRPYTSDVCKHINVEKKNVVFFPLSFTSDHIETLFEVEHLYLPLIRAQNLNAYRCPALNLREDWLSALAVIFREKSL